MRKVICSMNVTIDGYCDHTVGIADEQLHDYYTDLLNASGAVLYGRTTYQLMEDFWPELVKNPSGDPSMDDFARAIHTVPKIVFSHTWQERPEAITWENTRLATRSLEEEVKALRAQEGKPIRVGSPSLIAQLMRLDLVDAYELCIHPVVAGSGLVLFKDILHQTVFELVESTIFDSGVLALTYEPVK